MKAFKAIRPLLQAIPAILAVWAMASCSIEPPLHLPGDPQDVRMEMPLVITDMEVVWDIDAEWQSEWYYGWDEVDERLWGKLEYPEPTNYEVRRYHFGMMPGGKYMGHDGFTVYGNSFRRRYSFGYYNLLIWSNIDTPDHTQTVIIDESDLSNIYATTSKQRLGYSTAPQRTRGVSTHNQPEVFYDSNVRNIYISQNLKDYDYYNAEEKVWVKRIKARLLPVVYIYLVQVVLHNNNGRILGVADQAALSGLADGVNLNTGETSQKDANITFNMRMKTGIDCRGEVCDVIGGKLTTFGLCGMKPWDASSRGDAVTRFDIDNSLALCLMHRNGKEVVLTKDLTDMVRERPHGGVLTVHVYVDELDIPDKPENSGFKPTVEEYGKEEYEFEI